MSGGRAALSALDLVPVPSGSTPADALANTVDLARATEALGYRRYWIAEHHLNPGVAGTATPLVISLVAGATTTIRVGSGAVQMGHQTPLAVVEQFGLLDALHPGRIDLGLGRSGRPRPRPDDAARAARPPRPPRVRHTTEGGLLIPAPFDLRRLVGSPRIALTARMLQQEGAVAPDYAAQVADVVALLQGTYRSEDGVEAHVVPGEGAAVELWVLASSGGQSARIAGQRALPLGANYHVAPATVLDAVASYRAAFQPSATRARPYVAVSADVVVAPDDATAAELASPYGLWVHSIRSGAGAIPFPTPADAARHRWTDEQRDMVVDRVETQFVGSPSTVADQLEVLVAETGADEILVTTMTHDHADRVRSYELLAAEWASRA